MLQKLLKCFSSHRISTILQRQFSIKISQQQQKTNNFQQHLTSILDTGLTVASQLVYGQFCTLGVGISVGSRYEVYYPPGTAHFIEKIAFSSSKHFPDKTKTFDILDKCGAMIDCQSSRDTFLYASSCRLSDAFEVLQIIADAVFRPNILEEELNFCRDVIRYENETLARQPECEPLLTDWIHQAAFRTNTVGLPRYCASDAVDSVNSQHILSYLSQYYTPSRIVLAGVGVDQEWLIDAGKELFNPKQTTWATSPERLLGELPAIDDSLAQYTGGDIRIERDLSEVGLGPTPFPNLAHLVIGFQGVSTSNDDFVPFCVLQSLMGGGGSFSAGGPGKGMFTRLYTEVLNKHHWIYNATAYNHSYSDCGLFCIRGSADPKSVGELAEIIIKQFQELRRGVGQKELERAKVQLKSQLLMNLEMRPVQFEDLARQVLAHGKRKTAEDYSNKIEQVKIEDIVRIAHNMLESRLSFVGYGDLKNVPTYEELKTFI